MDYNRKYQCKYCDYKGNREQLVNHIENKHPEYVNDEYPAARIVYNHLNKVETGKCIICGKPTKWNDKTWKYCRHCGGTACKEKIKESYRKNAIAARGTYNFTKDPAHLEKMLAGRKISGVYTCSNGAKKTYTGSYERKAIEFMDKVLQMDPDDIMMPGPIFEYEYNGETHKWITDIYYMPYNLVIEVKDGGDNPNTREMPEYRAKQLAKEKAIVKLGTYNYLRLTNNNFEQLLQMFTALRLAMIDDTAETRKAIIRINESVDSVIEEDLTCTMKPDMALLFIYDELNESVQKIGFTDMASDMCIMPINGKLVEVPKAEIVTRTLTYLIKDPDLIDLSTVVEAFKSGTTVRPYEIFKLITGRDFITITQLLLEPNLELLPLTNETFSEMVTNALDMIPDVYCESTYTCGLPKELTDKIKRNNIKLNDSLKGYYLEYSQSFPALATKPTQSLYDTISQLDTFILLINKYGGVCNG